MFEGFDETTVTTGETTIRVRRGGSGPPLLLLHGHPETQAMWHRVAPRLAEEFTVVLADLRGYGASGRPASAPDHEPHSKRAMARDQIAVMQHFGFDRFAVAGHDRGGRVGYRLALDHPAAVTKLAVLDIVPTWEMYRRADMKFGLGYWHWFFLAQPEPFPERVIGADPDAFYFPRGRELFAPEALAEYLGFLRQPATIHALCEDYRAGATYDFAADEADHRAGHKIACPLLALWGGKGAVGSWYDVVAVWRDWANDVRGQPIDSGHFLAEERPEETYRALRAFFIG
ncbi:MAG TPA: alpha/beta hydrolase [Hyphomicrobiales bacterium]|nr:alpha/beta hydrolase [Hyphomicrobiales bacterium]